MNQATLILSTSALILLGINSRKKGKATEGLRIGMNQMLNTALLILCAFILAGMIEVLIPVEFVKGWLSKEAGLSGILLGTIGGMLLAMGPYASFPIIASILSSGAGLGTIVALITSWCLLGLSKAPFETAFYGFKFFFQKTLISIPFCIGAGLIAHLLETFLL